MIALGSELPARYTPLMIPRVNVWEVFRPGSESCGSSVVVYGAQSSPPVHAA